jgi:predicted DNA-binding protein YlxM (UPF0122 family)
LEAEAKAIRDKANMTQQAIAQEIKTLVGDLKAYSETYDFQCDKQTFTELQNIKDEQKVAQRLLAASGDDNSLREIKRGAWGDWNVGLRPGFCRTISG